MLRGSGVRMKMNRRAWLIGSLMGGSLPLSGMAVSKSGPQIGQEHPALIHPRLYCTPESLLALRAHRSCGHHALIWKNLAESAKWCLAKVPRAEWIAPVADDPNYENLYDRFYAMMQDMAITEHLAFAYALSGDARYGDAARGWTLACARAWRPDADAPPDGGKAYAVMRLLKGVATGYDLVYDRLSESEREEIRAMLATTAANYFTHYFSLADRSGPGFHTHHAIVEYSSFGIAALALLGEVPEADTWLDECVRKFTEDLLPRGLAPDGAQVEGATFWASTMHYRLMFMDALRRVTGTDLFAKFAPQMNADLALASIAGKHRPGWDEPHQSVLLSPPYGQLNYYAPALACLAREYRSPALQRLTQWDETLGGLQQTRYITPKRREQLLFELGGYAFLWYDASVPTEPVDAPRAYAFPSVMQAYARAGWEPGGLLIGLDKGGAVTAHAGGDTVLVAPPLVPESSAVPAIENIGSTTKISWQDPSGPAVEVTLHRPALLSITWRGLPPEFTAWSLREPRKLDGILAWKSGTTLRVLKGSLKSLAPDAHAPLHAVGNGKLLLHDPEPKRYPEITFTTGDDGLLTLEIETH